MDKLVELLSVEDYKKAIENKSIIVFSTSWCPDCHFMKTYIGEIVDEYPKYKFYYIDRDKLLDLCIELEILGIPSFVAYDHGQETGKFVSKLRKTKAEVESFIDGLGE
ncbi:thioredoxin family protein [Sharpea azabuensis]|uniref:thioredoxin family protein n=1 Tax=Sharpea azabuensis TaxID=322505 RepID=UPI0015687030|nr:thioredoxin family protein [Sharpea azabuensis]